MSHLRTSNSCPTKFLLRDPSGAVITIEAIEYRVSSDGTISFYKYANCDFFNCDDLVAFRSLASGQWAEVSEVRK